MFPSYTHISKDISFENVLIVSELCQVREYRKGQLLVCDDSYELVKQLLT